MICGSYKLGGKAEVGGSRGEVVILYIYSFAYHWLLWTATTQQVIFLFLNLELEKQLREIFMSYTCTTSKKNCKQNYTVLGSYILVHRNFHSKLLMTRKVRRPNQSTRKFGRRLNLALKLEVRNSKKLQFVFSSGSKGLLTASHQFLTPIRS